MSGWNRGLGVMLVGLLVGGGMPGLAEPVQGLQAQSTAQNQGATQRLLDEGLKLFQQSSKESLQQALVKFAEAIRMSRAANDKPRLSLGLLASGEISDALGDDRKALEFYNQALLIQLEVGNDRSGEATTLGNIGSVYSDLGENQKALEFYNQSLSLSRILGDRSKVAKNLFRIGLIYSILGEQQKVLDYYTQALPLFRSVGDRSHEATILSGIASVYADLGEQQKALEFYNQSLAISRTVDDSPEDKLSFI
jgi:tetratricopeptide (TPR) repeat protein